jgi:hypothetical protein
VRPLALARRMTAVAAIVGAGLVSATSAPASAATTATATGGGTTVEYVLHVPAMVVENLCNADSVVLSGDLYIRETTTPAANGGYTVQSTTNGRNLTGYGLPSMLNYRGDDRENSFAYYAPPPYPTTFYDAHYTKLVPDGDAPTMYLVVVLKEVVMADGTVVPVIDNMYLVCTQPTQRCWKG